MNKTRHLLIMLLVMVGAMLGGTISGKFLFATPTHAQQIDEPGDVQKWEYCAVTKAAYVNSTGGNIWIIYFRSTGVQVVEMQAAASDGSGASMAQAITRLGSDGWEMVSQGPLDSKHGTLNAIYFKRPKH